MNYFKNIAVMLVLAVCTCVYTLLLSSGFCEAYQLQPMQCPLPNPPLKTTSPWGEPKHGEKHDHIHKGIDMVDAGTYAGEPVRAVADGYVQIAHNDPTFDGWVVIEHADGWRSWYGDLMLDAFPAPEGSFVYAGQTIGYVGTRGGSHLHFEVRVDPNNESLCPWAYIFPYAPWLPPNCVDGAYMQATKAMWDASYDFTGPVKKVIDQITSACAKAIDLLKGIITYLIVILMTIDLCVSMLLSTVDSGKGSEPGTPIFKIFIFKCLIYLFMFFILTNWASFIGNGMRDFFVSSGAVMAGSSYDIASKLVADPFSMVTRGAKIITPLFEVVNSHIGDSNSFMNAVFFLTNFSQLMPAVIFALIIFGCFALFAIEIVLSMLEFYLMIVFSFPSFMFAGYQKTRQYAENAFSGIFACSIKLMFFVFFATMLQSVTSSLVVQNLVDKEAESVVWKAVAHTDGNFKNVEELEAAILMVETSGRSDAYFTPSQDGWGWGAWQISYDEWVDDYKAAFGTTPHISDPENNPSDMPYDKNSPAWSKYEYRAVPYGSYYGDENHKSEDWHDIVDENGNCIYTATNPWQPEIQDQVAKHKLEALWEAKGGDARATAEAWNGDKSGAYWNKVKNANGELKRKSAKLLIGPVAELTLICLFFVVLADHLCKVIMTHFPGGPGAGFRFIN